MQCEPSLACCDIKYLHREPINNPAACLSPAILTSKIPCIQGDGSVGGGTNQDPWIVDRIKRRITMMLLIISMLSLLYTRLQFIYSTLIHISFTHFFNFLYLSHTVFLNHYKEEPHFSSSSAFQHQENQVMYQRRGSRWRSHHETTQLKWLSTGKLRIGRRASSATTQESNGLAPIKIFSHVQNWTTSDSNTMNNKVGATATSGASGLRYSYRGGGWMRACAAGIQEGIQLSLWTIESVRWCI